MPNSDVSKSTTRSVLLRTDRHEAMFVELADVPGLPASLVGTGKPPAPGAARVERALACFERALALDPQHALARWNCGTSRLTLGDLARGWPDCEARWSAPELDIPMRGLATPPWRGDAPLAGKTILLHAEQGFGDTIQFARYAQALAEQCNVVLEVPEPLARLLRSLRGGCKIIPVGSPLPDFDLHCPLPSLPLAFGTTCETIPNQVSPTSGPTRLGWPSGRSGWPLCPGGGSGSPGPGKRARKTPM